MKTRDLYQFIDDFYESDILPSLADYIEIPAKSPAFDEHWKANGYLDQAMRHVMDWIEDQAVDGLSMSLHELPGRTPTLMLDYPGDTDKTVLVYGHLDKQPEFDGWHEGLGPWQAVRRDEKLYGRGGADDGYAVYAAIAMIKALQSQSLRTPRIVTLIESSEESGSPDLAAYMETLADDIGKVSLVIALDSMCGNYDQLWITTSLRGMLIGELSVQVLEEGAHSGGAGGIVASSFRLTRQILSRLEDENTGEILPSFLNEQIPKNRREEARAAGAVLAEDFPRMYTFAGSGSPMSSDPVELVLNNTWLSSMEVTGMDGIPSTRDAGNVLRPYTRTKFSLRLPPTTDAEKAAAELETLLTDNAPDGAAVSVSFEGTAPGWDAPPASETLNTALQQASETFSARRPSPWVAAAASPSWNFWPPACPTPNSS
ncbi:MAG: M20/M25/M40 family metallo-hydrolase [Gammaproteobacteria bacterium]|nr:M20/M25/M40 family metallo-hydrolase [Gammaproteobacteria bacterium]